MPNLIIKSPLVFFILFSSYYSSAQDFVFNQYNASPLSLNPAMTGIFDGSLRIMANHRNQWENIIDDNSYRSYTLSLDKKIKMKKNNYIGLGFLGLTDVAGETRLGYRQGRLSFSYVHSIDHSEESAHYLIVGQNLGISQRHIDVTTLRWPSQVVNGVFDPTLPGENVKSDFTHFDMTTGFMWISRFKPNNSFHGGLAFHHVNKPNVSFLDTISSPLNIRITFHAGGELNLKDEISIIPSFVYHKQGAHRFLNIGSGIRRYFKTGQSYVDFNVRALIGRRLGGGIETNALAFQVSSFFKNILFGFSYERVLNGLKGATSFEFSLGYTLKSDVERQLLPRL